MLSVQNSSTPVEKGGGKPTVPEDLGRETAHLLLQEIYQVCTNRQTKTYRATADFAEFCTINFSHLASFYLGFMQSLKTTESNLLFYHFLETIDESYKIVQCLWQ